MMATMPTPMLKNEGTGITSSRGQSSRNVMGSRKTSNITTKKSAASVSKSTVKSQGKKSNMGKSKHSGISGDIRS